MTSNFVFLTLNKKTNKMTVNVLLVDPYYKYVQIAIF